MPFTDQMLLEMIPTLEAWLEKVRPDELMRSQIDITYRFENYNLYISEVRPGWLDKTQIMTLDNLKATWDNKSEIWKVYWKRASGKWDRYETEKPVKTIKELLSLFDNDPHGCFKG